MSSEEIQLQLDELDTRLDRLRATYEQYFIGFEKTEPLVQRKDVERRLQNLRKMQLRNTALRFRFQTLVQRYTTYLSYWQRICRQIEEGTLKRDVLKAQRYGRTNVRGAGADVELQMVEGESDVPDEEIEEIEALEAADFARRSVPPLARTASGVTESIPPLPFEPHGALPPSIVPPAPQRVPPPAPVAAPLARTSTANPAVPPPPPLARTSTANPAVPPPPPLARTSTANPAVPPPPPPGAATPGRRPMLSPFGAPRTATQPGAPRTGPTPPPPAPPARTVTGAQPGVPPPGNTGASANDAAMRALYERYRESRRKNGENDVAYETVARQVRETMPRLEEKYRGQQVELDVTVKDGRTILRPVVRPKK